MEFKLLILLPLPSKCWEYRCVPVGFLRTWKMPESVASQKLTTLSLRTLDLQWLFHGKKAGVRGLSGWDGLSAGVFGWVRGPLSHGKEAQLCLVFLHLRNPCKVALLLVNGGESATSSAPENQVFQRIQKIMLMLFTYAMRINDSTYFKSLGVALKCISIGNRNCHGQTWWRACRKCYPTWLLTPPLLSPQAPFPLEHS